MSDPAARFELREHTADVAVAARGADLGATFAAVADGLVAAQTDAVPPGGARFRLSVTARSREAALFDYLDRLLYERDVRGVLPVANAAVVRRTSDGWRVDASARGLALDRIAGREVKAVTYSEMELTETPSGWRAYVVFDV
jgi:SHS2 domain-containing protein